MLAKKLQEMYLCGQMDQAFSHVIPEDKSHTIMCSGFGSYERNGVCSVILILISILGNFCFHPVVKEASVFSHFIRLTCLMWLVTV